MIATTSRPVVGQVVDRVRAGDEVDACGDHRRGVDERGDRGRALHRVREPGLQRELAGLAAGAEQQHQRDRQQHAAGQLADPLEHLGVLQRAEVRPQQEDRDRQADVADPVHEERLLRRRRRGRAVLIPADQQVRGEADALPAEVEHHEVVAQDEQQHRGDEQVELTEEPPPARVVAHVADGVQVDQRADTGDEQHERQRQRVEAQPEVDVQAADGEPAEQRQLAGALVGGQREGVEEDQQADDERPGDGGDPEPVTPAVRAPPGEQQHDGAQSGQREQQPGQPGGAGGREDLGQLGHVGSPPSGERCTKLS